MADRGYDSLALAERVAARRISRRKAACARNATSRPTLTASATRSSAFAGSLCKLKQFRSTPTRFDKQATNFLPAVALASASMWLR